MGSGRGGCAGTECLWTLFETEIRIALCRDGHRPRQSDAARATGCCGMPAPVRAPRAPRATRQCLLPGAVLQRFASALADAVYMHACWHPACSSERPFYGSDHQNLSLLRALCLEICSAKLETPAQKRCSARVYETRAESFSERICSI